MVSLILTQPHKPNDSKLFGPYHCTKGLGISPSNCPKLDFNLEGILTDIYGGHSYGIAAPAVGENGTKTSSNCPLAGGQIRPGHVTYQYKLTSCLQIVRLDVIKQEEPISTSDLVLTAVLRQITACLI